MNVRALIVGGGLIGLLAAGLAGIWAYHVHEKTKARDDLEFAATRLSDCLLGGPADGDVDDKLHRVQISARAAYAPDTTPSAWPKRCASYTQAIVPAHRAAYARGVVKVIPSFDVTHDELAEGTLTSAASMLHGLAEFTHGPHDASVPAAPVERKPLLTKATIKPIGGDAQFGQISQLLVRSQEGLRFGMVDATLNGKRSCEYAHSAHAIRCISTILNADLFAGDIGSDFAYSLVSNGTAASVFGVGSEPLAVINDVQFISHGRTFRDGHLELQMTMANDGTFVPQLFERDRVGHIKRTPFEITSSFGSGERLAGDFIVWKERPSTVGEFESPSLTPATEKPATIKARALVAGSHAITVGTVGRRTYGEERTDGTCEADHLFFDMSPVLAIRDDKGGWHTLKPDALAADSFAARTMSCHGDLVTMVDRNEHAVHVQRCSVAAGCSTQTVTVDLPKDAMVATVGADTLVIWADEDADAIYFVRSPLADLPKAEPKVLIDSALVITKAAPGDLSGLTSMSSEAFSFADEAIVFLGDTMTYALSIKPDGTASSISASP